MEENRTTSYTSRMTVTPDVTAERIGSGDMPVLATPAMMALMENAAMMAARPLLEEGETTVGGQMESTHLKPSPVGTEVTATATLTAREGKKLRFRVEAHMGDVLIGEGTHLRFVVDREKFLGRMYGDGH